MKFKGADFTKAECTMMKCLTWFRGKKIPPVILGIYKLCKDFGLTYIKTAPVFLLASSEPSHYLMCEFLSF